MSTTFQDERLKLLFVRAHPAIDPAMHTPLMLQTVLGLDAARIAQAFLIAPKTMGQRLFRAKAKSAVVASSLKFRKNVICRSGSRRCLRRSMVRLESAGTKWLVPTSVAAIWPKKRSGLRGCFCSCCRAKPRSKACWPSCCTAKHGAPHAGGPMGVTSLFPSRIPSNGRFH